jgi:raffinose/stachyose/melibiose transport system substrate-binding protein
VPAIIDAKGGVMLERIEGRSRPAARHRASVRLLAGVVAVGGVVAMSLVAASLAPASVSGAAMTNRPPTEAKACGTRPVTMNAYVETGFPDPIDLMNLFHNQYPNVSWKVRQDAFAVITQNAPLVLSGPNPPDIMRLPQVSGLVKDHLLKNLDGYFKAYGWSKFPASQLSQVRMPPSGRPRGTGSLWAYGLNYSLTGVFYNKALAAKAGITSPPTTLAEFDADLAKAKKAGLTPIVQFDGGATGGLLFPLQQLMAIYGPPTPINNWIFQRPGANIDTPSNLQAATHLQQWIKAGYFNSDANATDYPTMMSKFEHGEGVFMFDGDWESGNLQKLMPGQVGFFLMPTLKAGQKHTAMSAPLTYGIAAKAKHAGCAAFFFNWVTTNPKARALNVSVGGSNPGGPPALKIPVPKGATLIGQTLAAGRVVAKDNGAMDFIANATSAIYAQSWTPEVQKLFAGQESPDGVLKTVQADYLQQVKSGG